MSPWFDEFLRNIGPKLDMNLKMSSCEQEVGDVSYNPSSTVAVITETREWTKLSRLFLSNEGSNRVLPRHHFSSGFTPQGQVPSFFPTCSSN